MKTLARRIARWCWPSTDAEALEELEALVEQEEQAPAAEAEKQPDQPDAPPLDDFPGLIVALAGAIRAEDQEAAKDAAVALVESHEGLVAQAAETAYERGAYEGYESALVETRRRAREATRAALVAVLNRPDPRRVRPEQRPPGNGYAPDLAGALRWKFND